MAGAGGTTPLRLKDLLELDCDSCSAAGFRCYPRRLLGESSSAPTMRRLLESPSSLRRHNPSKLSHLSRSLSRRLLSRGGLFGRRRDEDEDDGACAADAPSGSGSESGPSSSSETTTSDNSSGRRGSRCESDSDFSTATTTSSSANSDSMDAAAAAVNNDTTGDEHEGMKRSGSSSGSEPDDKEEQLSPVAVMDFPSDDDEEGEDGDADGASFSLARLQRRKMLRRQYKIRRFRSTQELGPVDLETLLAATSESDTSDTDDLADDVLEQQVIQNPIGDTAAAAPRPSRNDCHGTSVHHGTHEHGLLELLVDAASAGVDHVSERLLLDFSIEMKRRRGSMEHSETTGRLLPLPREAERLGDGEVVAAAKRWLDGAGSERWGLNDVLRGGEAIVAEMERGRRWMQVGEEEREVGAMVAGMLADQLVDEVVWDLLV